VAAHIGAVARSSWPRVRWLFGVAVIAAVVVVSRHLSEGRAFVELAEHVAPAWLALGVAFQLGTYLADARSWQRVLWRSGVERPLRDYVSLGLAKLFVDQAIPSGGISGTLVVVRGLERRGVQPPTCMAAVVVDLYAFYGAYITALLVAFATLAIRGELRVAILITAAAFLAFALFIVGVLTILTTRIRDRVPAWFLRLRALASIVKAVAEADQALVRRPDLLVTSFGHQLAVVVLDGATLWAMVRGLGIEARLAAVFASFVVSSMARTLGIFPGGLGTFEAASVATLSLVGTPVAAALTATLLFRGLSFWFPLLPGVIMARREAR
jgi:uncharacterized protein (TIRG00374 family)